MPTQIDEILHIIDKRIKEVDSVTYFIDFSDAHRCCVIDELTKLKKQIVNVIYGETE